MTRAPPATSPTTPAAPSRSSWRPRTCGSATSSTGSSCRAPPRRARPAFWSERAKFPPPDAAVGVARIGSVSALADLPLIASGKVREIYEGRDRTLLIVASDRISTYDVVHPTPIPDKGAVLTGLSTFWFERTAGIVPNHMLSVSDGVPAEVRGRGMLVRRLEMLPIECVVRGYITGSGWKDYQRTGTVSGLELPAGLRHTERLA